MAEHATKKPNSSSAEPVEMGVILFFCAAAAALVLWIVGMPGIAKWVILGGLGLHALIAVGSSFGEAIAELNTKPSFTDLRNFGLIFLVGTGILGLVFWQIIDHDLQRRAMYFFIVGGAVMVLALVPGVGRLLYILWMGFGLTLGLVTSPIIMFALFLFLITPVALFFKVTGRDLMRRKLDEKSDSYWEDYPRAEDPSRYVKQF